MPYNIQEAFCVFLGCKTDELDRRGGTSDARDHDGQRVGQVVSYLVLALQEAGVDPEIIARMGPTLAAAEQDVVAVR